MFIIKINIEISLLQVERGKAADLDTTSLGHSPRSRNCNKMTLDNAVGVINLGTVILRIWSESSMLLGFLVETECYCSRYRIPKQKIYLIKQ